jgi:hypothetical protein
MLRSADNFTTVAPNILLDSRHRSTAEPSHLLFPPSKLTYLEWAFHKSIKNQVQLLNHSGICLEAVATPGCRNNAASALRRPFEALPQSHGYRLNLTVISIAGPWLVLMSFS